jgi:orotate phosphoribosyltransferase
MDIQTTDTTQELALFARRLMAVEAVKIDTKKGFRLKLHESHPDAPLSPYYFNLRIPENKGGPLTYSEVESIGKFFHRYALKAGLQFDALCGVPRAGEPFAKVLQDLFYHSPGNVSYPIITLNKVESAGGRKIGEVLRSRDMPLGSRVLLVDDLITEAGSKVEAIVSLRGAGFIVNDVIVFLDREQGASAELLKLGVRLHAITTVTGLLDIYEKEGLITQGDVAAIREYRAHA